MRITLEHYLKKLDALQVHALLLDNTLSGIEKENLRVTQAARIAQTPHPMVLGASLTHPFITTDYAESLLELITPPLNSAQRLLNWLEKLHVFTYQGLNQELLWSTSMPCIIDSNDEVIIAQYGQSNQGRMRTLYRVGLGHRYEKKMQTIAGIHFNYSLPLAFWPIWQQEFNPKQSLRETIDSAYFAMTRNFLRYGWLIDYLFGASSAFDRSFLTDPPPGLKLHKQDTLYAPYACSLRMSDLGYHNTTQKELHISFNTVQEYAQNLAYAINTPYPPYEAIFTQHGENAQINANLLQIEAEFYAPIRPKRVVGKAQRQSQALLESGVEYLEVRSIDINPYEPLGVTAEQIYFTEVFLLYCLLQESPAFTEQDYEINARNTQTVVLQGRKPDCELLNSKTGKTLLLRDFAKEIFNELIQIADFLDKHTQNQHYTHAIKHFKEKVEHPELLPSAQMLEDILNGSSFVEFALNLSEKHKAHFSQQTLTELERADFKQLAQESLQQQHLLEAQTQAPFAQFIKDYFI